MMAVTQIRYRTSAGQAYQARRRAGGKTGKEASRFLKQRLADVIYRQPVTDAGKLEGCGSPTTATPTPPAFTSQNHLTAEPTRRPPPSHPPGVEASIALDWQDNRLVGIEILDANIILPGALIDQAEDNDEQASTRPRLTERSRSAVRGDGAAPSEGRRVTSAIRRRNSVIP
jgi:hypothetical protein